METLAVIDFETTGLGATQGGRATEIAAVLVQDGQIVGRFQSLMNSGAWVPPFITQLTGISNEMLQNAPPAHAFACTMLLSRRLYPHAENHRLGTLARLHALPSAGRAYRALADAEVTAHLLMRMQRDVRERFADALQQRELSHAMLTTLQRAARGRLAQSLERAAPLAA